MEAKALRAGKPCDEWQVGLLEDAVGGADLDDGFRVEDGEAVSECAGDSAVMSNVERSVVS